MSFGSISAVSAACPHLSAFKSVPHFCVPHFCVPHFRVPDFCFALVRVLALRLEDTRPVTVISSRKISYSMTLCSKSFSTVCRFEGQICMLTEEQFDMEHAYRGRPPAELDVVLHRITTLITCWEDMDREGVPLQDMTNLIESLSHEPLARAVTADPLTDESLALAMITPAMNKAFDAVMDNLRSLLRLHIGFKHKGFSVQGIHQLIRGLVKGPLTRAAIGRESTLGKSSTCLLKH